MLERPAARPAGPALSAQEIPPALAAALPVHGISGEAVRICTDTDLDLLGDDARQWLVMTDDRLAVFASQDGCAELLLDLSFEGLCGARADARVGSGMFQVEVAADAFRDVLLYSNEHAAKFGRLSR